MEDVGEGARLGVVDLGQPVVAVVVFGRRVLAEERLEVGDQELRLVCPVAVCRRVGRAVVADGLVARRLRPLQVAGHVARCEAQVGCTLDVGLAAECGNLPAGDADVAEQQLDDGHHADVAGAGAVLGLAECVQDRARLADLAGCGVGLVDELERLFVHATRVGYGIHVVARVVLLHDLVDAVRVLERRVFLRVLERGGLEARHAGLLGPAVGAVLRGVPLAFGLHLVAPRLLLVAALLGVPAGKRARLDVKVEFGVDQVRGVGVVHHVLALNQVVFEDVVDHAAVERDVGAGADGAVDVCLCRRARETRVDDDPLRALVDGAMYPFHGNGVAFCMIGAACQQDVSVGEVAPLTGHCTAAECWSQTGNR